MKLLSHLAPPPPRAGRAPPAAATPRPPVQPLNRELPWPGGWRRRHRNQRGRDLAGGSLGGRTPGEWAGGRAGGWLGLRTGPGPWCGTGWWLAGPACDPEGRTVGRLAFQVARSPRSPGPPPETPGRINGAVAAAGSAGGAPAGRGAGRRWPSGDSESGQLTPKGAAAMKVTARLRGWAGSAGGGRAGPGWTGTCYWSGVTARQQAAGCPSLVGPAAPPGARGRATAGGWGRGRREHAAPARRAGGRAK